MLDTEAGTILLNALHGLLKDLSGIDKLELLDIREDVFIHKVGLLRPLFSFIVIDLSVDSDLGLVFTPLSNEELVLVMVEVTALAFTHAIDPVAFEMISVSLGQDTVTVAFAFVPLSFVNILCRVDHATLSLRLAIDPVTVVSIAVGIEEGAATVASILVPVTGVLTSEFAIVVSPLGALAMLLVNGPHSFVLVAILIILNTEAFLAVISPVSDVPG